MQAPQPPIDIKVTLGSEAGYHNLINLDFDFVDSKEQVKQFLAEKKFTEDFGKDCVLMFDFYVENGKQKQAVQYFNQAQGKSPLQILFNNRPEQNSNICKFSIQEHQGFIRIMLRFFTNLQSSDVIHLNDILTCFETNGLVINSHINFELKGIVSHNKKNRANVKVDYAKFHLVSNAFSSQCLMNSLTSIQQISQQLAGISDNPFFQLIKKSKIAKVNLKLDSFRRLNKYYNSVMQNQKQAQTKQFKYTNKGIFRQRADASMVYNNKYLIKINGRFESEDVFIRLLKVYSKFFEKLFNQSFYYDD